MPVAVQYSVPIKSVRELGGWFFIAPIKIGDALIFFGFFGGKFQKKIKKNLA
jgi:hypothetical protein